MNDQNQSIESVIQSTFPEFKSRLKDAKLLISQIEAKGWNVFIESHDNGVRGFAYKEGKSTDGTAIKRTLTQMTEMSNDQEICCPAYKVLSVTLDRIDNGEFKTTTH